MIHEALPAILIRADKNSSCLKPFQRVCNCSLCFVGFLSALSNIGRKELMMTIQIHVSKQKKCKNLHLFHLLHANIWLKSRCVEG